METLLLRLSAPLQAWGADSDFETRRTMRFPTKSGVVGMLAAALGYDRDTPADELNNLFFGVRVDFEGDLLRDYHTVKAKHSYITTRYYLADAIFLVGLSSDDHIMLEKLAAALRSPAYPLFLGRRSCPPTAPLVIGIRDTDLLSALRTEPWLLPEWRQKRIHSDTDRLLRIITDGDGSDDESVFRDLPVSFSRKRRAHTWREVRDHGYIIAPGAEAELQHDPISELE